MLHPPAKEIIRDTIVFRNDDVAYDTNAEHFKEFCELFHKYGFVQLHGINLYGLCNDTLLYDGIPWIYKEITPDEYYIYEKCVSVSKDYIGDNRELVDYINSIPDPIALHGLYHSDYSQMTYEQQENDIKEGLRLLKELFPKKKVETFIAPFNHTNEDTYKVCEKYGLKVSALEGEHLEDRIENGKGPLYEGELYRYHHHRFYPESTYEYYKLNFSILEQYFSKFSYTTNVETGRVFPSKGMLRACNVFFEMSADIDDEFLNLENQVLRYVNKNSKILINFNDVIEELIYRLWWDGYNDITVLSGEGSATSKFSKIISYISADIKICDQIEKHDYDAIIIDTSEDLKKSIDYINEVVKHVSAKSLFAISGNSKSEEKILDALSQLNGRLINCKPFIQSGSKAVWIYERNRPKVCLYCDRPKWAFDITATEIKKNLSDEYDIDIKYVIDKENIDVNLYDIFEVFFWGETSYQKSRYSKSRIIKQVCSHRWQYDEPYGPISVTDFSSKYLSDASTIMCPSKILFDLLREDNKYVYLCGEGIDSDLFYYKKERVGNLSLCMVGNLKDPVKGVQDILLPAAEGYKLNLADKIEHSKLVDFYNENDIYVVASKHEANPLPLIEAMACGCFPVATKIGIAPELIRHKENGFLVKNRSVDAFREAFEWCAENIDYIRKYSKQNANEVRENRDWENMAESYRLMYRNHIGRR